MKTWKHFAWVAIIAIITIALFACGDNNGDNNPTTYTVTFDSNGGSAVNKITGLESGATIAKPTDPTKADNTFDGWYKESALTTKWNFTTDTVTANITLYAKWIETTTCACNPKAHLDYKLVDGEIVLETCDCGGIDCDENCCTAKDYGNGETIVPFYKVGNVTDEQISTTMERFANIYATRGSNGKASFGEMVEQIYVKEGQGAAPGYDETTKTLSVSPTVSESRIEEWMDDIGIGISMIMQNDGMYLA